MWSVFHNFATEATGLKTVLLSSCYGNHPCSFYYFVTRMPQFNYNEMRLEYIRKESLHSSSIHVELSLALVLVGKRLYRLLEE